MAIPAALTVMGALSAISSIGSAISNSMAAKEQQKLQREALDMVKKMDAERKAVWAKELEDFETMFGPMERTLNSYYNDLTADKAIASGMQEIAKSYNDAKSEINAELAQRGLATSGAAAASMTDLSARRASAEATVRKNAQAEVMAAKRDWYSVGLDQKNRALQGYTGALNQSGSTYANLASGYGDAAAKYNAAAGSAMSSLGSSIGSIASAGLKYSALGDGSGGSGGSGGTGSGGVKGNSSIPITTTPTTYYDFNSGNMVNTNEPWYMKHFKG